MRISEYMQDSYGPKTKGAVQHGIAPLFVSFVLYPLNAISQYTDQCQVS